MPEIHFYRRNEGEDKTEVTREEYYAAIERGAVTPRFVSPANFRIGDVNYFYEYSVPPMTEEEVEEAKAHWLLEFAKNQTPKLLLEHDEPAPDGWTEDMIERRPPRVKGEMTLHLPEGSHNGITFGTGIHAGIESYPTEPPIQGVPSAQFTPVVGVGGHEIPIIGEEISITGFWERWGATSYPTDDEGTESPLAHVEKFSMTLPVPQELIEDSQFDLEKYLREGPGPKPEPTPLTRRERVVRWYYRTRERVATYLYEKISGHDLPEERDDY